MSKWPDWLVYLVYGGLDWWIHPMRGRKGVCRWKTLCGEESWRRDAEWRRQNAQLSG